MVPQSVASRPGPELCIAQSVGDVDHLYCCDPDLSLCGEDISGSAEVYVDEGNVCPLCDVLDLMVPGCPRCGE
jgi:hypothetical protein